MNPKIQTSLLLFFLGLVTSNSSGFDTSSLPYHSPSHLSELKLKYKDDHLYVHLIPHTHDDAGWLKTVDMYYVGAN
jgi:hypothetical protein